MSRPHGSILLQAGTAAGAGLVGLPLRWGAALLTAHLLGRSAYGGFVQATTVLQLATALATLGFAPGVIAFVASARAQADPGGALRSLARSALAACGGASLALSLLILAVAPFLGALFEDALVERFLRGLAPVVLLVAPTTVVLALVQGLLGVRTQALVQRVVVPGSTLLGLLVAWRLEVRVQGAVLATLAGSLVGLLVALAALARRLPRAHGPLPPTALRPLLARSWPLAGSGLLVLLLSWMDVLLLGALRDSGEVGGYGAAVQLVAVMLVVHETAGPLFLAHASAAIARDDRPSVLRLYRDTARWSTWSAVGVGTALVVFAPRVLALFGPEFTDASDVLVLLVLGRLATALTGMCGKALIAHGHSRLFLADLVLLGVLNAALDLAWIPAAGGVGAARATLVALLTINGLQTLQVWRLHGMLPFGRHVLGALGAALVLGTLAAAWRDGPGGAHGWLLPAGLFVLAWIGLCLRFGVGPRQR